MTWEIILGEKDKWHCVEDTDGHKWLVDPNGLWVAAFMDGIRTSKIVEILVGVNQ